jgi:predicted methyltransferase
MTGFEASWGEGSPRAFKEIAAAVADTSLPPADIERDAGRRPAETLAFAGVKPGDNVADYAAGSGYFTRMFPDVFGPTGHVYAVVPSALFQYNNIVKGPVDMTAFNKAVYDALKPGALYVVLDHSAAHGAGAVPINPPEVPQALGLPRADPGRAVSG